MKTPVPILLFFAFLAASIPAQAAPTAAQADDVREAVFRVLFVRAKALMPEAKVYILEKETHYPPQWGNMNDFDPSAELSQRFADSSPHIVPLSQSGGGSSPDGEWHEDKNHAHGPLLQIVSLRWLSDTSVEAETYIDAGLPRPAVSCPYLATLRDGRWAVREDAAEEWWQAVHEGALREAVVRYELAQGVYGVKPGRTPCYLTFGGYGGGLSVDPPEAFMARFAGEPAQLRRASERPENDGHHPWMMFGIQDVRWISDTEAQVDGGGTHSQSISADSILYEVTRSRTGWKVQPVMEISI